MTKELVAEFQDIFSELEEFNSDNVEKVPDEMWELEDKLRAFGCKLRGGHTWAFDMCMCWGHQYCVRCGVGKYPELIGKKLHTLK